MDHCRGYFFTHALHRMTSQPTGAEARCESIKHARCTLACMHPRLSAYAEVVPDRPRSLLSFLHSPASLPRLRPSCTCGGCSGGTDMPPSLSLPRRLHHQNPLPPSPCKSQPQPPISLSLFHFPPQPSLILFFPNFTDAILFCLQSPPSTNTSPSSPSRAASSRATSTTRTCRAKRCGASSARSRAISSGCPCTFWKRQRWRRRACRLTAGRRAFIRDLFIAFTLIGVWP